MKLLCISASNVKSNREKSASTKVCSIIKDIVKSRMGNNAVVDIIRLVDYDLKPCIMCGECAFNQKCKYDEDYNFIFDKICSAEGIFIVCPHYASIPSKLMIILEKLEEFAFFHYCSENSRKFILKKKKVAIIGHGGQVDNHEEYYKNSLLEPISTAMETIQMDVVGLNKNQPFGISFGIIGIYRTEHSVLPVLKHDWSDIEKRITPLVDNLIKALQ